MTLKERLFGAKPQTQEPNLIHPNTAAARAARDLADAEAARLELLQSKRWDTDPAAKLEAANLRQVISERGEQLAALNAQIAEERKALEAQAEARGVAQWEALADELTPDSAPIDNSEVDELENALERRKAALAAASTRLVDIRARRQENASSVGFAAGDTDCVNLGRELAQQEFLLQSEIEDCTGAVVAVEKRLEASRGKVHGAVIKRKQEHLQAILTEMFKYREIANDLEAAAAQAKATDRLLYEAAMRTNNSIPPQFREPEYDWRP